MRSAAKGYKMTSTAGHLATIQTYRPEYPSMAGAFIRQESTAPLACGFTCDHPSGPDEFQTCLSVYFTGSFPVVQCTSGKSNGYTYQTVPAIVIATASQSGIVTHTLSHYIVRAPLIQINHMATDLPTSTQPWSGPSSPSVANVGISISADLSPAAITGIIVAACLGTVILLVLIAWWWFRCGIRRNRAAAAAAGDSHRIQECACPRANR
ncbi:hypothetical protein BDV28DRAFT_151414 [Aspergillus coremiiformis]|uniref:Uncharacterized protein n=1 Tax=Aspergillus coremiiformis TaxID=138285 RepID=A0A5N6YZU8_9EURO|nr:hypothetical protein BDV28DRAFT_151414 [Aspergillus coremiiformis]